MAVLTELAKAIMKPCNVENMKICMNIAQKLKPSDKDWRDTMLKCDYEPGSIRDYLMGKMTDFLIQKTQGRPDPKLFKKIPPKQFASLVQTKLDKTLV